MDIATSEARLARVRAIARTLDSALIIPGTSIRFGLDPIIGLVPGLGDLAGAACSGYIVIEGIRMGVSRAGVLRMIANVGIDTFVGSVPVLGDVFDAGWKANNRNVALIERHMASPSGTRTANRLVVLAAIVVLLLILAAGIAATAIVVRFLFQQLR
ncbi:hypothetical protein BH09GEM1_BH09GEM1_19970 [soil metagenome]